MLPDLSPSLLGLSMLCSLELPLLLPDLTQGKQRRCFGISDMLASSLFTQGIDDFP